MEIRKILVTGSAGFIGFHLVDRLLKLGIKVIGVDNINDYYDVNLKYGRLSVHGINISENIISYQSQLFSNYQFYKVDITDVEFMNNLFDEENFDIVVNLAAQPGVRYSLENPRAYTHSNIDGFLNILECCRNHNIRHLLYASSSSVYGLNKIIPFKESDTTDTPISFYAATKKANELFAHTYSHLFNLKVTGLRFFTVYGPWGRPDMALFLFTKSIIEGNEIEVYNNGKMMRDFTYVNDVIESIVRLIIDDHSNLEGNTHSDFQNTEPLSRYNIFNIGNSSPVNLIDYIKSIEDKVGRKAMMKYMELQSGDLISTYSDSTSLQKLINFIPSTALEEGISEFVDWYKSYYLK
jgi:UDP-glucuronate 4-epimerase